MGDLCTLGINLLVEYMWKVFKVGFAWKRGPMVLTFDPWFGMTCGDNKGLWRPLKPS